MPIEYFLGKVEFFGREFEVNKNVLIPRRDTEVLVFEVQKRIESGQKVLELCTGSGCVAVTLALGGASVTATDISEQAIEVAQRNSRKHQTKVEFVLSDMFEKVLGKFNAIVCNPPYIKTGEIGLHDPSILHEPRIALDGGEDGLRFYRILTERAGECLVEGGFLALEIGFDQAEEVSSLLDSNGWKRVEVVKDTKGQDRVLVAYK